MMLNQGVIEPRADRSFLEAQLVDQLRLRAEFENAVEETILSKANLPTDESARAAIVRWMKSKHVQKYITAQSEGLEALSSQEVAGHLKHLVDYLHVALTNGDLPKQSTLTPDALHASPYQLIKQKAEKWMAWQNKQLVAALDASRDYAVVQKLSNDMQLVELKTPQALDYEGQQMGHCSGGGSYDQRLNGQDGYRHYSIWDAKGVPHCTFEVYRGELQQCQGKGNQPVTARYVPHVMTAVLNQKWKLGNTEASRTGLVKDNNGKIYSVCDLPEVFDGTLNLDGVAVKVRLPRHVKGDVSIQNAAAVDLSRAEIIDGGLNAAGTRITADATTAQLRAIKIGE